MSITRNPGLRIAALTTLALVSACDRAQGPTTKGGRGDAAEATAAHVRRPIEDRPLAAWRRDLLEIAFRGVSALPLDPHIKDRSEYQQDVVRACLELEQPVLARTWIEEVRDWRAGLLWADYASYCAERGDRDEAGRALALADRISTDPDRDPNPQKWRRDRVRAAIARTWLLLGERDRAHPWMEDLEKSELGAVSRLEADKLPDERYDAYLAMLDEVLATQDFERVQAALLACTRLHDRFFDDAARRQATEERVMTACAKLPFQIRLDLIEVLAETSVDHGDKARAKAMLDQVADLMGKVKFLPQDYVEVRAHLARLRQRARAREQARHDLEVAMAMYEQERARIFDILRADALRPVAEAWHALGDRAKALETYRRAVEEGVLNPNSRPRAEDLSKTCLSLAVNEVEPDAALRARLVEICEGLGHPW
ncbi:MAG: hypothetical protein R3F30_14180 [Planctomycetota bacterium]